MMTLLSSRKRVIKGAYINLNYLLVYLLYCIDRVYKLRKVSIRGKYSSFIYYKYTNLIPISYNKD